MPKSHIFLVSCPDTRGVLYFLTGSDPKTPGLFVSAQDSKPLVDQLYGALQEHLGLDFYLGVDLEIAQDFEEVIWVESADSPQSCLYLGKLAPKYFEHLLALGAKTLPDLLRGMPSNKSRAAYLKAFQFFAGTAKEALEAIESKT